MTADFTVELKRIDEKTMIVRAARAKLVSAGRSLELEGVNEKGPVKQIISQGNLSYSFLLSMIKMINFPVKITPLISTKISIHLED